MNKLAKIATAFSLASLVSCSGGDSLVDVEVTSAMLQVVPGTATSCVAQKTAEDADTVPTSDIAMAYFKIPKMKFNPAHSTTRDVFITSIEISYTLPGSTERVVCPFAGDSLAALRDDWWNSSGREAKIAANSTDAQRTTTCAMYCGGINKDLPAFSATAEVRVYGYEQNPSNENDQTGFLTLTYVTFGKNQ
ncbi:MAG: hypothetical protein J7501_08590 [Bdellovibrio sp.]|nr:hypothetical protein [Bdellovibrio sp.]